MLKLEETLSILEVFQYWNLFGMYSEVFEYFGSIPLLARMFYTIYIKKIFYSSKNGENWDKFSLDG